MKPSIFDYEDVFKFLTDYFNYRKSQNQYFSYHVWAKELGIKSRSHLRMMILGKRKMSMSFAIQLASGVCQNDKDTARFLNLVDISRDKYTTSTINVNHSYDKVKASEVSAFDIFLSDARLPKLVTLLSYDETKLSLRQVSQAFSLTEPECSRLLSVLESLNLIERTIIDNVEYWHAKSEAHRVQDKPNDQVLKSYHQQSINEALKAVDLPQTLRRFTNVFVAASEKDLIQLHEMLNQFAEQVVTRFQTKSLENKRLFQLNFSTFATSNEVSVQK